MRRTKYLSIVFSIIALGSFGYLFFSNSFHTVADKHEFWISIEKSELYIVEKEMPQFKFEVKQVEQGIAIVHISNGSLERLSTEMHEHFHKCSGFVAYETEDEAVRKVLKANAVDGNEQVIDYTINNASNVNQLVAGTQEPNVRQMIIELSSYPNRRYNQPEGLQSAQFIKNKWTELANGRSDISVDFFNHPTIISPQPSVILTITGTVSPNEIVVLGGHQDSINTSSQTATAPGADDDASGISSLTEAIRVISDTGFRPEKTVKFMAYAAEEVGLRGSNDIAENFESNNINVIGVLQLDMTNFNNNSQNIDFAFESSSSFINLPQTQFMKDLIDIYLPTMNYSNSQCGYGCSDHKSWHDSGYAASFPFEAPFGQHNNNIHKASDKIDVSNGMAVQAEKFSKLALTFVGELAKGEIPVVVPTNRTRFDFDGDNKTDVSIFRPNAGEWWFQRSIDGNDNAFQFGGSGDTLIPSDYTGDGKTDIAFWRNSTDIYVLRSDDSTFYSFPFGASGDIHTPGDFDGDGKDDTAVYRPTSSTWFIFRSSDSQIDIVGFGIAEDQPVVADYDGDGRDDIAIYRPSNSQWWINRSTDGVIVYQFGSAGDKTVQGDYTGDGKADVAFWRESTGEWFIIRSNDDSFYAFPFGSSGDIPTPGDFDGDGKNDAVVYRPTDNTWYKEQSTNGFEAVLFGSAGDIPLPNLLVKE